MNINIKPKRLYKIIKDTGKPNKDQIIRCVEMMAWEAEELCSVWGELINISKSEKAEIEDSKEIKSNLFSEETPLYGRLINFYRNISNELGGKTSYDWIEEIYNRVAKVLLHKSDVSESLEEFNEAKLSLSPLFLSSDNNGAEIKNLESSLLALQNEVQALKSLPESLKLVQPN